MLYENNEFYEEIYSKKLKKQHEDNYVFLEKSTDPKHLYRENIYGFRSNLYTKNLKFLAVGCSITYGFGVNEENIWANILSKNLNKSCEIVANPGVSIEWLIDRVFKYFYEFGHPETVVALFPDLLRINLPVDGKFYRKRKDISNNILEELPKFYHSHLRGPKNSINKSLIKMPYDYEKSISPHLSIYNSIKSIKYLEQYCEAVGIKLLWSTWDNEFLDIADKVQSTENLKFNNYFDTRAYKNINCAKLFKTYRKNIFFDSIEEMELCDNSHRFVECSCYKTCHSEFAESMGQEFDYGTDNKNRLSASHPGGHYHLHIADAFEARMKELGWV